MAEVRVAVSTAPLAVALHADEADSAVPEPQRQDRGVAVLRVGERPRLLDDLAAAPDLPPDPLLLARHPVDVIGAGVAGLQAIATAHRLGAIVEASDLRPAAKEQVESLGGDVLASPWNPVATVDRKSVV